MAKEEIGQSVAKAIVGTVGSGLLGVLLSVVAIRDWAVECLRSRPAEFIFGFLVSAAFGGAFTFFVYGAYARKKFDSLPKRAELHERDERIRSLEAELRSRPTAERLEEARAALDERPTRAELDAERAVSAALRAELETRPTRDQWAAANDLVEQYKGEAERLRSADSDSLDSFSLAQLVLMQRVLRAMDEGGYLVARSGSSDSDVGSQLVERDVLDWSYDGDGGGSYSMRPKWVSFMRRNGGRVEARISELRAGAGVAATPTSLT